MLVSSSSTSPPHDLQLVVDFVNTLDRETGVDEIDGPAGLTRWLRVRGLMDSAAAPLRKADHSEATELREALRRIARTHSGGRQDPQAAGVLERTAARGRLSVLFAADGTVRVEPRERGFAGTLAKLLVPVARAAADGTWERFKACEAQDCQWAFYDRSRNRSGRWCHMAVCGNRTKVRAYRTRHADQGEPG